MYTTACLLIYLSRISVHLNTTTNAWIYAYGFLMNSSFWKGSISSFVIFSSIFCFLQYNIHWYKKSIHFMLNKLSEFSCSLCKHLKNFPALNENPLKLHKTRKPVLESNKFSCMYKIMLIFLIACRINKYSFISLIFPFIQVLLHLFLLYSILTRRKY